MRLSSAENKKLLHLLDGVEHLFEFEAMVAEDRVGEVVKVRFTGFAPVLLSVFACGSSLDDLVASAVDARHRLPPPLRIVGHGGWVELGRTRP
jgi:hypothetical protein